MATSGAVRRRTTLAVCAGVLALAGAVVPVPGSARADDPGPPGGFAFVRDGDVWVAGADGSAQRELLTDAGSPAWSADGRRLAFVRGGAVWVSAADGTGQAELVADAEDPTWSPTGDRIGFERGGATWVADADGSGARQVSPTTDPSGEGGPVPLAVDPDWSPDGTTIAVGSHHPFAPASSIYGVDPAGRDWHALTVGYADPDWSPTGDRIARADSAEEFHHAGVAVYVSAVGDPTDQGTRISPEYAEGPDGAPVFFTSDSPSWSPDAGTILFASDAAGDLGGLSDTRGIWSYATADATSRLLVPDGTDPSWRPATAPAGPDCSAARATPRVLQPSHGRFRLVRLSLSGARVHVRSVRSDEPHPHRVDWFLVPGRDHVWLRAARWGRGDGRTYTIRFTATLGAGRCSGTVTVSVPRRAAPGPSLVSPGRRPGPA